MIASSLSGTREKDSALSEVRISFSSSGLTSEDLPWMILALCAVMLVNFYSIQTQAGLRKAYLIMLGSAVALLHLVSYSCGGIRTAGTLYFGVIILYAYMLLGRKSGKAFTIVVITHVAYLFIVSTFTDWTSFRFF
jgi:hypothetical protein